MPVRNAQIVASLIEVLCPYCSEPRPNPDNGADGWTPRELAVASGSEVECNACDRHYRIATHPTAKVIL
jgi:hypothetical protein